MTILAVCWNSVSSFHVNKQINDSRVLWGRSLVQNPHVCASPLVKEPWTADLQLKIFGFITFKFELCQHPWTISPIQHSIITHQNTKRSKFSASVEARLLKHCGGFNLSITCRFETSLKRGHAMWNHLWDGPYILASCSKLPRLPIALNTFTPLSIWCFNIRIVHFWRP